MKNKDFGIGEVVEMTGLSAKQLRYWEDKNIIPQAVRIVCGERRYRRYDEELVVLIRKMKELIDDGMTVSAAANKAKAILSGYKMGGNDNAK